MRVEILLAFGIAILALTIGISIVMILLAGKRSRNFLFEINNASARETDAVGLD